MDFVFADYTLMEIRRCFEVASITWMQRKMASAIVATPPTSSYEEVSFTLLHTRMSYELLYIHLHVCIIIIQVRMGM